MASIKEISRVIEEAYIAQEKRYQDKNPGKTKSNDLDSGIEVLREKIMGNTQMIDDVEKLSLDWNHVGRILGSSTDVKIFKRGIQSIAFLASGDEKHMKGSVRTAVLIFAGLYLGITEKADLTKLATGQEVAGIDSGKRLRLLEMAGGNMKKKTFERQLAVTLNPGGLFEILNIGKAQIRGNEDVSRLLNNSSPMTKRMISLIEKISGVSLGN